MKKKLCLLLSFPFFLGAAATYAQCDEDAAVAYDDFNGHTGWYAGSAGTTTTNTFTYSTSCPFNPVRASVWDGDYPGLGITNNSSTLLISGAAWDLPSLNGLMALDVAILATDCSKMYYLVVFKKGSNYLCNIYKANCSDGITGFVQPSPPDPKQINFCTGALPDAPASGWGIHVDADERGNFAIVFNAVSAGNTRVYIVYGTTTCDGPQFCNADAPIEVNNSGTPTNQYEPDVTIAPNFSGHYPINDLRITYVKGDRTKMYIHQGRFQSCEGPNTISAACVYTPGSGNTLYNPRLASQPFADDASGACGQTVVVLEKNSTQYFVRGYTWYPTEIDDCPDLQVEDMNTYNDGSMTYCDESSYETDHPVVTYNGHITNTNCYNLLVGWNVDRGGSDDRDAVVVQCRKTGPVLASPNDVYYNVNNGSPASGDQYALSIDGRYANTVNDSIQYMFFDANDNNRIKGKWYYSCSPFSSLRTEDQKTNALTVFPNPANDVMHIQLSNASDIIQSISIIDVTGRIISTYTIKDENRSQFDINTEALSEGMYFLKVEGVNDNWKTKIYVFK